MPTAEQPINQLNSGGIGYIGEGSGYNYAFGDIIGRLGNTFSGTAAQNQYNAEQASITRQFNAAEAEKARAFEKEMSSTAYQRAVADMAKAGLNPATLAGMSGSASAASTPSGSAASAGASAKSASRKRSDIIGALVKVAGMIMLAG